MAAGAWTFYNSFKKYLGTGAINLSTGKFRMALYTSASNAATATLSTIASVSNQVAEQFGYSSSGKQLTAVTWQAGASASEFRFDATSRIWSAVGGAISAVKFAVIWQSGGKLVCRSQLSAGQFSITDGNTLTVTPSANGIFELN